MYLLCPAAVPYATEELLPLMMADKKRSGDRVDVIVPEALGRCGIRSMDAAELLDFMRGGC